MTCTYGNYFHEWIHNNYFISACHKTTSKYLEWIFTAQLNCQKPSPKLCVNKKLLWIFLKMKSENNRYLAPGKLIIFKQLRCTFGAENAYYWVSYVQCQSDEGTNWRLIVFPSVPLYETNIYRNCTARLRIMQTQLSRLLGIRHPIPLALGRCPGHLVLYSTGQDRSPKLKDPF